MNEPAKARVEDATKDEESRDARASHTADRPPTPEEESAAEEHELDPEVAARANEMGRRGAEVKGEGRID